MENQFRTFMELLKKLYLNVPFTEVLSQISTYSKFLKEIISKKLKLEDNETVAITTECSALIQNMLQPKLKYPGSFSIPCEIGTMSFERTLCNVGANISLMPLSVCKKLNLGEMKPISIYVQLTDKSIKYLIGILEDGPIRIGKLYIPTYFVNMEIEEDYHVPIILGRSFVDIT